MYTLVSAAVLAADLAEHPSGGEIVDVLDRAVRLDGRELAALSAAYRDDSTRQDAWAAVEVAGGLRTAVPAGGERRTSKVGARRRGGSTSRAASYRRRASDRSVGTTTFGGSYGGFGDLLRCLHEEVLGWTRRRVDDVVVQSEPLGVRAVTDALGAAYTGPALRPAQLARLTGPWREVFGECPSVASGAAFGPRSAAVRSVVDRLSRAGENELAALAGLHHEHAAGPAAASNPRDWAQCMHVSCQAAFLHGRVREVASAQLAVARALRLAQVPPELAAGGVLTAATGTVQAVALADVLPMDALALLTRSWATVFGAP